MYFKARFLGGRILCAAFILSFFLFPMHAALAQDADGIPLQKDVLLGTPIFGPEDLPEEITFTLFDAQSATIPLGSQTFRRGQYTVDFEFSQSDGITGGNAARIKANFTQMLNLVDALGKPLKPTELWAALEVAGAEVGSRTKVSDETMVQLLLNSDASMSTYLTLAYEGDDNPLATIYKGLPLSSASGLSAKEYITSLFSSVSADSRSLESLTAPYWEQLSGNIFYNNGNVGVGTNAPSRDFHVSYSSTSGGLSGLPTISVANTNPTSSVSDYSFASFEFSGNNGGVVGEFFADGSGLFLGGTPSVYFRASTNHPILLGTNKIVRMIITNTGSVGIGTTSPAYNLAVNGTVGCKELTVTSTGWADFVFQDNYRLPPLEEVESFIAENKHLPGIPSEKEVLSKGVNVGDMNAKLLQKVEELTLYMIELKKENTELKAKVGSIQEQIGR